MSVTRTSFATSRLLDFVSEKELTLQCGYGPGYWPLVVVKELIDNTLDACEEQGIPPEVTVTVDESSITVEDNGTGIPPDTVDRLLDMSIRVSSREAYVAPDAVLRATRSRRSWPCRSCSTARRAASILWATGR